MADDEAGRRRARGELESEVMTALWAAGEPLTPAGVQQALGGNLAYNTIQTILIRLLDKDLVRRGPADRGRGHAYWPAQDAATLTATRMRAALDERPDRRAVLQQFAAGLGEDDAETLRALLAERES
ncbi:BlaI/MecI/CopY family transcriptional regulator [Actinoplanes sp. NPDC051513]|uniref:BlaI/MecI/CopY family transcriptional regulator n=1 Tax=Actinoplanes sp. NPDC051513 TaxID=3363908 RepID=UPI003795795D